MDWLERFHYGTKTRWPGACEKSKVVALLLKSDSSKDAVNFVGEEQQCPLCTWVLLLTMFLCVGSHDTAFLWFCCVWPSDQAAAAQATLRSESSIRDCSMYSRQILVQTELE